MYIIYMIFLVGQSLWYLCDHLLVQNATSGCSCFISSSRVNHIVALLLSFTQTSCLKNISQDLHHYYRFLSAQPDPDRLLHTTILSSLQELMQVIYLSIYLYLSFFMSWLCKTNHQQKCPTWDFEELEGEKVSDVLFLFARIPNFFKKPW